MRQILTHSFASSAFRGALTAAIAGIIALTSVSCGTSQQSPDGIGTVQQSPNANAITQPVSKVAGPPPSADKIHAKEICVGGAVKRLVAVGQNRLGIVTWDNRLEIWDVDAPKKLFGMEVPLTKFSCVVPVTESLVAWSNREHPAARQLVLFDTRKGQNKIAIAQTPGFEVHGAFSITTSRSGRLLAWVEINSESMPEQNKIRVADIQSGKIVADIAVPLFYEHQHIGSLAISPDDRLVTFGSAQGECAVGMISINERKVLWNKKVFGGVWAIAFDSDSKSFWATDSVGQLIRYDTKTDRELDKRVVTVPSWRMPSNPLTGLARDRLLAVDVSPDGRFVAIGTDYNAKVMIWEISSGHLLVEQAMSSPIESALCFAPDSKGIWAAGSLDQCVQYIPIPQKTEPSAAGSKMISGHAPK